MEGLSALIEKIAKKLNTNRVDYEHIASVLSKKLGVLIKKEQLSLKGTRLVCTVSTTVKNEIQIKKQELLLEISPLLPKNTITTIE